MNCAGINVTGYRKGELCGAPAKYMHKGKSYCAVHNTIAKKEPFRFKSAVECWEKAKLRQIRKQRAADALKNTQIDAFDVALQDEA
jgi:hypothetical protein